VISRLVTVCLLVAAARPAAAEPIDREALAAARQACEHAEPACDPSLLLSRLERRAVDRALEARGLTLDHAPHGKRIGRIHVVTLDVFGPSEGFLRWFNVFHVTTREGSIRNELMFAEGTTWDQRRADESARRLRDPVSTSLVAIVPVVGAEGTVDVLVVTRDVWSLRMNSNYEFQEKQITLLAVALSENNLFGRRKLLAATFRMDQGSYTIGPLYIDKNMFGRHLDLRGRGGPVFNRQSRELEGSESTVELGRPLWSLDTEWGAGIAWSHRYAIERSFVGTALRTYDAPETPEDDLLPYEYQQRKLALSATVVRGFGDAIEHQVRAGYQLTVVRPTLLDDFPADPVLRESFITNVMPRSERISALFAGWKIFEPRYRNYQNLQTFELAEDTRLGPEAEVTVSTALRPLGSEASFVRLSGNAAWTGSWGGDGLWRASVAATTRLEDGEAIDNVAEAVLRLATPSIELGRLASQLKLATLFNDTQNEFYTVGGDNGLRGYPIGFFQGDRRALWQTELRSRPVPVLFTRVGLLLFHDVGGAAASFRSMKLHHDAGIGLRALVPQLNPDVFRFDLAVALDDDRRGQLRFSAGYEQSF
jgi:hypothetical protein